MTLTPTNEGLALFSILRDASVIVQFVMLLLLAASLVSWTMIFRKWSMLKAAARAAERFESRFWSGGNLNQMFKELSQQEETITGMDSMFVSGFKEYARLEKQKGIQPMDILEGVQRAMRVALTREMEYLDTNLSFLATVGSISPYVGLFGTVWGIMSSFQSIAASKNTSLAVVAPGIAEALFATAIGLIAAIPATIFYNKFTSEVNRQAQRLEGFADEFSAILSRQIDERA